MNKIALLGLVFMGILVGVSANDCTAVNTPFYMQPDLISEVQLHPTQLCSGGVDYAWIGGSCTWQLIISNIGYNAQYIPDFDNLLMLKGYAQNTFTYIRGSHKGSRTQLETYNLQYAYNFVSPTCQYMEGCPEYIIYSCEAHSAADTINDVCETVEGNNKMTINYDLVQFLALNGKQPSKKLLQKVQDRINELREGKELKGSSKSVSTKTTSKTVKPKLTSKTGKTSKSALNLLLR